MSEPDSRAPFSVASAVLVACFTLLTWLPRLSGPIDLRYDAGVYYILGSSLAEGRGYRLLNEPGEIHAIQYPPLLPLIVAAHVKALGTSDPVRVGQALRISFCVLSLLYAVAVYALARLLVAERLALAAALLNASYGHGIFLSDLLFAELPFALVTVLFFLARRLREPARTTISALLAVSAFLLRTMGIALLLAWVAEALLERRFRASALRAAVALVPLFGWQAYVHGVQSGAEYAAPAYAYQREPYLYYNVSYAENIRYRDPFRPEQGEIRLPERVAMAARHSLQLPLVLGEATSTSERFWKWAKDELARSLGEREETRSYHLLPLALVGSVALLGILVLAWRGERLVTLYLGFSAALIFATPWPGQFTRYAVPLAPFAAIGFVSALDLLWRLASRWRPPARRAARGALAALGLTVVALQGVTVYRSFLLQHWPLPWLDAAGRPVSGRAFYYGRSWTAFDLSLEWLRRHAAPGDVVASSAPHHVYLRTGLKAVMVPMESDPERAQRLLDGVPVRYLIVDDMDFVDVSRQYGLPVTRLGQGAGWERVYSGERLPGIYRRRGEPR